MSKAELSFSGNPLSSEKIKKEKLKLMVICYEGFDNGLLKIRNNFGFFSVLL